MKVVLIQDDVIKHSFMCMCGFCNISAKSFGVAIVPADADTKNYNDQIIDRVYGASKDMAMWNAEAVCRKQGYEIQEGINS